MGGVGEGEKWARRDSEVGSSFLFLLRAAMLGCNIKRKISDRGRK